MSAAHPPCRRCQERCPSQTECLSGSERESEVMARAGYYWSHCSGCDEDSGWVATLCQVEVAQ